jgi:hypothetical protein
MVFNNSMTVVGLIFNTRAVSRTYCHLGLFLQAVVCLRQIASVGIAANKGAALTVEIATLVARFPGTRATMADDIITTTVWTKNGF